MFTLHPVLATDTVEIVTSSLSLIRLMNDCNYPWVILIPARPGITGIHQLQPGDAVVLTQEISRISAVLENLYAPDRINVAALGNVVPQLHVHIIARFENDPTWPGPVWGNAPRKEYNDEKLLQTVSAIKQALKDQPA